MTAPNTGAPSTGNAPINAPGSPGATGQGAAPLAAHAGGPTLAERSRVLEEKYGARFEGTHALDRSSYTVAIVLADGTRIAGTGESQEAAVTALETRLDRIGAAFV